MKYVQSATLGVLLLLMGLQAAVAEEKIVIAHRGASGYLPEHTLAAKAAAYFMGVDYIEQDLVMTKDDRLVVLHDRYLDRVTDVMTRYPDRYRMEKGEKRWFAIDFTLAEIKTLQVTEGFQIKDGKKVQGWPGRFPMDTSFFTVPTFAEEVELIQGLNRSTGRNVGIYPECKAPWFHHDEGKDISLTTLQVLRRYGYRKKTDKVYVQCFDPHEVRRIKQELLPALGMDLKVVQLIARTGWHETMEMKKGKRVPYDYNWMFEKGAMEKIAAYADGIGPWKPMIVKEGSLPDRLVFSGMVEEAHGAGLEVHPYTFRQDPGRIPVYARDFEDLLDIFYYKAGVDGVFTDFPDRAVAFLRSKKK